MSNSSQHEGIQEEIRQIQNDSYYNAACIAALNELSFAISIQNEQTGQFIYCNRAFQEWMHIEESELVGKQSSELFPDDPEPVNFDCPPDWPLKGEFKRIRANNQEFLVQTHQVQLPAEDSDETLLLNIYLDKSREAQELARLCRSEKDFENSEILARIGHWTYDFSTDRIQHSSQSQRILDLPPELTTHNWMRFLYLVHPDDRERVNTSFKQAAIHQTLFQEKFNLRPQDEKSKRIQSRGYFEYNEYGAPGRFLGVFIDINEYEENVEKLLDFQKELETSDAVAKFGHWTYERETNMITLSSEISRLYKLSQVQLSLRTLLEFIQPLERKKLFNILRDKTNLFETEFQININQQKRYIYVTGRKYFNDQGKISKSLGTIQDITHYKQTVPIETDKDLYQGIFARSQDGMLLFKIRGAESEQPQFWCHDVNRAFLQQFNVDKNKVLQRSFHQLFSRRARRWIEHLKTAVYNQTAGSWEIYRPSLERYFNVSVYSPRKDFLIMRFHDITDDKLAEEQYKTSDLHLNLLMENSIDTFWITSIDLKPILISRSASVMRGFSMQEIYQQTLKEKLTLASYQLFFKHLRPFLKQVHKGSQSHKPVLDIDLDFRHKNGGQVPVKMRITAVYNAAQQPVALVGVNRQAHPEDQLPSPSTAGGFQNVGLWCFDAETEAFLVTQKSLELINYDNNHIENIYSLKDWVHLVVHPDDKRYVFKTMQQALNKGQGWEVSYRLKSQQNGKVHETTQIELDSKKRIVRIWGILQEYAADYETAAVQEQEESFVLRSLPDIFIRFDRDLQVNTIHIPPRYRDIFMQEREKPLTAVLPKQVKDAVLPAIERLSEHPQQQKIEFYITIDGNQTPFEARIIPEEPGQGVLILRELCEQNDETGNYEIILNETPERIACLDISGRLMYANTGFYSVLGYTKEDFEDESEGDLVHPEDKQIFIDAFQNVQENGKTLCEYRVKTKDGNWKQIEAYATLLTYGDYASCSLWVSHEKREEQPISEQVQAPDGFMAQLPSTIAGDFTDILQVIENYNDLILDSIPKEGTAYDCARSIKDTCDNGAAMVRRLVHFSAPRKTKLQTTDLNILIYNLTRTMDRLFGSSLTIRFIPDVNIKPINVDPEQIEDLLMNLCMNARDAIDEDGQIILHTRNRIFETDNPHPSLPPGHYIMISVQDDGPGVSPDLQEKIFNPFFTTKTTPKAIGLGLSIVKSIAEQHNGMVELDPKAKQGALFNIYLPVNNVNEPVKETSDYPRGSETILVADDEPHICEISRTYLEDSGYKIWVAHDGEEALEMYKHHQNDIDLLVLDVLMPNMNGKQVYDEIKKMGSTVPVLFCSGYTLNLLKNEHDINLKAQLLKKPFNKRELLQSVRQILDSKKRMPE
ncbi:MAG: PAS domain-containing protein [candidate division KSB1 bacterium]|nr:PAS domain-containing protein [candidate division KSB1 bacterium]